MALIVVGAILHRACSDSFVFARTNQLSKRALEAHRGGSGVIYNLLCLVFAVSMGGFTNAHKGNLRCSYRNQ